ncbi:recombinase family protein [Variovorax sp. dw_308]|uniref:recombinase family protein n=2 Tax=unclassified Variovorax TaxID=663243 RepID=UPI003529730B
MLPSSEANLPRFRLEADMHHPTQLTNALMQVPAAQYLRMSTDHQRYSIANQCLAIRNYADQRGMVVVRTYADEGKSGLDAVGRDAFLQLIADVESGQANFRVILVFDVSRWGRFQNTDESAFYEYRCTRARIPVVYCYESFDNDGSPLATLIKNIKRSMDGEYSRVLSAKVYAGQCRLAEMGYFQGGPPGYGLRRRLVGANGEAKGILEAGEQKNLRGDRVVLIPGPPAETRRVRQIFSAYVERTLSEEAIAQWLNRLGVPTDLNRQWTRQTVHNVLTNERYLGCSLYNRRTAKLKQKSTRNAPVLWIRREGMFKPIVEESLFERAQALLAFRSHCDDATMLRLLRELFARIGSISVAIIDEQDDMPCAATYRMRFGSLPKAYALAGLEADRDYAYIDLKRRLRAYGAKVTDRILRSLESAGCEVLRSLGNFRCNGLAVALTVVRCGKAPDGRPQWRIPKAPREAPDLLAVVRMAVGNTDPLDYYLIPREECQWLPVRSGSDGCARFQQYKIQSFDGVEQALLKTLTQGRRYVDGH